MKQKDHEELASLWERVAALEASHELLKAMLFQGEARVSNIHRGSVELSAKLAELLHLGWHIATQPPPLFRGEIRPQQPG